MNPPSRIVTPERRSDDVGDTALRPQLLAELLSEFVGQAQATAVATASRSAGENAETAQLIRPGLKELAK